MKLDTKQEHVNVQKRTTKIEQSIINAAASGIINKKPYSEAFGFKNNLHKFHRKINELNDIQDTSMYRTTIYHSTKDLSHIVSHFLVASNSKNIEPLSLLFQEHWEVALFTPVKGYMLSILGFNTKDSSTILGIEKYNKEGGMIKFMSDYFQILKKTLTSSQTIVKEIELTHSTDADIKIIDLAILVFLHIINFSQITRLNETDIVNGIPKISFKQETPNSIAKRVLFTEMLFDRNNVGEIAVSDNLFAILTLLENRSNSNITTDKNKKIDKESPSMYDLSSSIINADSVKSLKPVIEKWSKKDIKQAILYSKRLATIDLLAKSSFL